MLYKCKYVTNLTEIIYQYKHMDEDSNKQK